MKLMKNLFKMSEISGMRKPYNTRECCLLESNFISKDPYVIFQSWFDEAVKCSEIYEPNAMCLATASKDGIPTARFVLLKSFNGDGFKFFTNYSSDKGKQLALNPFAAATFYWAPFSRSVRIEGSVEKLPMEEAVEYFKTRSYASQIGALCSNQSTPICNRQILMEKEAELKQKYKEGEVPKPETWGGYIIKPNKIEFWQGQTDRIHDRIRFKRINGTDLPEYACLGEGGWYFERLAP